MWRLLLFLFCFLLKKYSKTHPVWANKRWHIIEPVLMHPMCNFTSMFYAKCSTWILMTIKEKHLQERSSQKSERIKVRVSTSLSFPFGPDSFLQFLLGWDLLTSQHKCEYQFFYLSGKDSWWPNILAQWPNTTREVAELRPALVVMGLIL